MTFQACATAVYAFQFSIPVICIDAAYKTTINRLVTMCFGTAPSESDGSWCFFMANLRQTLRKFCPNLTIKNVVFMSDRHSSIAKSISYHFPKCHHLLCTIHILRNLTKHRKIFSKAFWNAVEAEFTGACGQLPQTKLLAELIEKRNQWSRYSIREKDVRRYKIRTDNPAEVQNSALKEFRNLPILKTLIGVFHYTMDKVCDLILIAKNYVGMPNHEKTP